MNAHYMYIKNKIRLYDTDDILHSQTHHAESICFVRYNIRNRIALVHLHDERSFCVSCAIYILLLPIIMTAACGRVLSEIPHSGVNVCIYSDVGTVPGHVYFFIIIFFVSFFFVVRSLLISRGSSLPFFSPAAAVTAG